MSVTRKIHADRILTPEEVYRSFRLTAAEIRSIERAVAEAGFGPVKLPPAKHPRSIVVRARRK